MADEGESLKTCGSCGATIYPEHIERRMAALWEGQLLCRHCLAEKRSASGTAESDGTIRLADFESEDSNSGHSTQIRQFGGGPGGMSDSIVGMALQQQQQDLRRPLLKGSSNATRCRTFHGKLTDAALAYLNDQINSWIDENADIEIKFATCTIGVIEGKHADPHLLLTVFY